MCAAVAASVWARHHSARDVPAVHDRHPGRQAKLHELCGGAHFSSSPPYSPWSAAASLTAPSRSCPCGVPSTLTSTRRYALEDSQLRHGYLASAQLLVSSTGGWPISYSLRYCSKQLTFSDMLCADDREASRAVSQQAIEAEGQSMSTHARLIISRLLSCMCAGKGNDGTAV